MFQIIAAPNITCFAETRVDFPTLSLNVRLAPPQIVLYENLVLVSEGSVTLVGCRLTCV